MKKTAIFLILGAIIAGGGYFYNKNKNLVEVKLYYSDATLESTLDVCSGEGLMSLTRKIPMSTTFLKDTIDLLIRGEISEGEAMMGADTEFPLDGFALTKAEVSGGVATLEFLDPNYKTSGGSCRVNILRAQIEKTAMQFEEVKSVKILPEEILQP